MSSIRGWVYVIANKAMPGLVKVGYSMKDPSLRAGELGHTGTPHPYSVEYDVLLIQPREVEQQVHVVLSDKREGKEWFRCTVGDAIAAIRGVAGANILLECNRWQSETPDLSETAAPHMDTPPKCAAYGCAKTAEREVEGSGYCKEHWLALRRPGRGYSIARLRSEIERANKR